MCRVVYMLENYLSVCIWYSNAAVLHWCTSCSYTAAFSCGLFAWVWSLHNLHAHAWWYCTRLMSTPICHHRFHWDIFCHQLSTCIELQAILPSLPASACHPEKPSLFSCTATTMTRLRGTLTPVKRPRAPAGMASLIVPFTEVIAEETERKSESGLLPPPLKAKFRFFLLVCHQVTYKWSLMKTAVKLVFILSHYSV